MHYGSMYTMADYTTDAQTLYTSITGTPIDKLRLTANVMYNMATAEYDPVIMPDVSDRLDGNLTHQDFTFDEMHEYSNLDYNLLQLTGEVGYLISPDVTFTVGVDYADLSDDTGWVYGDESGSIVIVRSGFRVDF